MLNSDLYNYMFLKLIPTKYFLTRYLPTTNERCLSSYDLEVTHESLIFFCKQAGYKTKEILAVPIL